MASSSSNGEEKLSKRKVDELDSATKIKTKKTKKTKAKKKSKDEASDDELSNIVNAITAKEAMKVQAWKQVVTDLAKAGIVVREKDVQDGEIVWEWDNDICIKLKMVLSRVNDSKDLVPQYEVCRRIDGPGITQVFEANEWDELVEHLFECKKRASCKADYKRVVYYLETETEAWKELFDALHESDNVPDFSDCSIEDGLIMLTWTREDRGFEVTVERRTRGNDKGDVYEVFCVQKSPLKQDDASIVRSTKYLGLARDVLDRITELLE